MEKEKFTIEIKLENLKTQVESILEQKIKSCISENNVDSVLSESIGTVFKTSWNDSRGSKLRQIINDAIDGHIRNCVYSILDKTEIKNSIEKAIESNLLDGEFIASLAKAKTYEILTIRNNN